MEDFLDKHLQELALKVEQEIERLITEAIKEKTGLEIDLINEVARRFPRITRKYNPTDQCEDYYWNDGSEKGLHLIGLHQEVEQDFRNNQFKFNITIKKNGKWEKMN